MAYARWTTDAEIYKYASEKAFVYFDFSSFLATGETLQTVTAAGDAGITVVHEDTTGDVVTISVEGGTANLTYDAECRIVTSNGQERRYPVEVNIMADRV